MDRLWYDPNTNTIRVGDGNPGGRIVGFGGNAIANISIYDEGVFLTPTVSAINFVGNGVTANATGSNVTVTVISTGAQGPQGPSGPSITVLDEGITLVSAANSMNFVGEGVVATNTGNAITVTVGPGISYLYSGAFHFDTTTTLTSSINSNSTNPILVGSTTGFYPSGYIIIGTEVIKYTGITATSFTGITRAQAGSNGANHDAGAGIGQAQSVSAGNIAQVLIDTVDIENNITLDTNTGNITIGHAGTYNLQFSVQSECFGNTPDDTAVWFTLNGNAIPASASYCTVPATHAGQPGSNIMTVNIFYPLSAGDVIALSWTSIGGTTTISSIPSVGGVPTSPGLIFTINRVY